MQARDPALLSLAVAEAPHAVGQDEIRALACRFFDNAYDISVTGSIFESTGIKRRTFVLPLDGYSTALPFAARNRHYIESAGRMLRAAAARAVPEEARSKVTHVVLISSTGIATPSLDCNVIQALGIRADAHRVPVFGLGCAGGVSGLQIARDLARSDPNALVLVLCVELTSLTLMAGDRSLRNFVACALFGDGAAAALVGNSDNGQPPLGTLGQGLSRLFPDTEDLMGWDVREEGWRVVFSPRIPGVVRDNLQDLVADLPGSRGARHFLLHPGGRRILEAYRDALDLSEEQLEPATTVLERHGNMSAVTVFFVLDHVLRSPGFEPGPGLMTAFGPGFSAQLLSVELQAGQPAPA
ncbi:MAG: type III polyketide synthase [Planctomycetota bacterium]|nr:type III polyketide synthase [Planctomycetota bacterium]